MRKITLAVTFLLLTGCATVNDAFGPNQDLSLAGSINSGMSPGDVLRVMQDKPVAREFAGNYEEWHYCDSDTWTGRAHKYLAIYFINGAVVSMKPYGVSVRGESVTDCGKFVKQGNYSEPDVVREYRVKYR
jgi:hypothetical protein